MNDHELEIWMDASARILKLGIPEVCREGVLENIKRNFAMAEKLRAFPLPPDAELAPVFTA